MKALDIIKFVFSFIGAAFLAAAFWMYSNTEKFLEDAVSVSGEVVELVRSKSSDSTTYRPVVEFSTNEGTNIEFTSNSGSNPPSFRVGEIVEVLYQPKDPHRAKINSFFSLWGIEIIFASMGAIFLLIGSSFLFVNHFKQKKIARLKSIGIPVRAKFIGVERNGSIKMNGRNPFQICAQWKDPQSNDLYVFKSDNLWFDPSEYIKDDKLSVLIDPRNPKKHYMEIGFLPDLK